MHEPLKAAIFRREVILEVGYPALVYVPSGLGPWPLCVFLHGAGERGRNLEAVTNYGPPRELTQGRELPFVLVAPQCPEDERWDPLGVLGVVEEACAQLPVMADRVVITGLSMGGEGTWLTLLAAPGRFRAAALFCGRGVATGRIEALRRVPIWVTHGEADSVVPVEESDRMVGALQAAGGKVRYDRLPGIDHDCWSQAYSEPEIYDWLAGNALGPS